MLEGERLLVAMGYNLIKLHHSSCFVFLSHALCFRLWIADCVFYLLFNLLCYGSYCSLAGVPTLRPSRRLPWLFVALWQSIVPQFGHGFLTLGWLMYS